jgi:predicted DCC family thiol-disulfide oxidoreductase YuxK
MMNLENELQNGGRLAVVYDGDCPFCSSYVTMTKVRNAVGKPTLLNARERPDLVRDLARSGIDLDSGMAVYYQGRIYVGGEAMHLLALLSEPEGLFDKATAVMLRWRSFALWIYPALRSGRNLLVKLRNRPPLQDAR